MTDDAISGPSMGDSVSLDLRQVAVQAATSRVWLHRARIEESENVIYDQLVHRLTGYVLSDHLATDQTVVFREYPASWWQHTKRVHFPTLSRWLRRPVRYTRQTATVSIDSFATFPEATVPYPPSLGPLRMLQEPRIEYDPEQYGGRDV